MAQLLTEPAKVLVPEEWLTRARESPGDTGDTPGISREDTGIIPALITRAERAEERADEANKRADVAVALADRTLAQLTEANTERAAATDRAERAEALISNLEMDLAAKEQAIAGERNRADAAQIAQAEAEASAAELRQAEIARRGQGRWARLRRAWRR